MSQSLSLFFFSITHSDGTVLTCLSIHYRKGRDWIKFFTSAWKMTGLSTVQHVLVSFCGCVSAIALTELFNTDAQQQQQQQQQQQKKREKKRRASPRFFKNKYRSFNYPLKKRKFIRAKAPVKKKNMAPSHAGTDTYSRERSRPP